MALTFISCASAISRPLVTSIVAITRRLNSGEIVKWLRTTEWQSYCFANLDLFAANELIVFTELWPIFQHPCFGLIKRLSEKSQHAVGLYPRHTTVHRTTLLFFGLLRRAQGSCVGPGILRSQVWWKQPSREPDHLGVSHLLTSPFRSSINEISWSLRCAISDHLF
jgi:hypothetical protein